MAVNVNQKGGHLEGAALTDEVMESASNLLASRQGNTKGLQQFYAPAALAKFTRRVLGNRIVLDPTAGDGSLISHFDEVMRFGIEIDSDQITAARRDGQGYKAIQGDVQHVQSIISEMQIEVSALAMNPPFGLKWSDPLYKAGAEVNSAEMMVEYASRILSDDGTALLLTGGDGGWKNLAPIFEERGWSGEEDGYWAKRLQPYLVIECDDLWAETQVSNQIILMGWVYQRRHQPSQLEPVVLERPLGLLNAEILIDTAAKLRRERVTYSPSYADTEHDAKAFGRKFNAVQGEYDLRAGKRIRKTNKDYDVYAVGNTLHVAPRPFVKYKLAGSSTLENLTQLHKQPLTYFALNPKRWKSVVEMEEQGTLVIHPPTKLKAEKVMQATTMAVTPLNPLKPQQRLGWLEDVENIKCIKTVSKEKQAEIGGYWPSDFTAGETYPINVQPFKQVDIEHNRVKENAKGGASLANYRKERWILKFRIDNRTFYENKKDIEFIIEHFEVPDPGSIRDKYPEVVEHWGSVLDGLSEGRDWEFKDFQRDDLARLLTKDSGLLAWEQGLGKTLAGLTFAKAHVAEGAKEHVLIVCPQDLIPQWKREAKFFYGQKLVQLKNKKDFLEAARNIKAGGTGWYITHYQALSVGGRKSETTPLDIRVGYEKITKPERHEWTGEEYITHPAEAYWSPITRETRCERCGSNTRQGYDPMGTCHGRMPHYKVETTEGLDDNQLLDPKHEYGSECGNTPWHVLVKANYNVIKGTFRDGVVICDELTEIKSDQSLKSKAIRGLSAKHRLGMTGTPIKNYAPDAYWGLWFCLGNATPRFPFNYVEGQGEFESHFSTLEWRINGYGNKEAKKRLPEVSNISKLWRLLAPSVVRRRKEESGEPLVERTFYPTLVPVGISQRKQTDTWLKNFAAFFKEKFPDHELSDSTTLEALAPMLGMQWKLEFSATMPLADPDAQWWVERKQNPPISNWTPKNARVLELALHHAALGDKVLIGSAIKAPGKWFKEELNKRLAPFGPQEQNPPELAINILTNTEDEDILKTMSPPQRAKIVQEFQAGKAQVLVSSHALNLGHNLDKGSVVILTGLPWDYATFDQFIARVHRLTSEKAVKVYVVLAAGTIDERKWKLLIDKASAANLALDGRLIEEQEEQIDKAEILRQMMESGIPITGDEVDENDIEAAWANIKSEADLPELVLEGTPVNDLTELQEDDEDVPEEVSETTPGSDDDAPEPSEPEVEEASPAPADDEVDAPGSDEAPVSGQARTAQPCRNYIPENDDPDEGDIDLTCLWCGWLGENHEQIDQEESLLDVIEPARVNHRGDDEAATDEPIHGVIRDEPPVELSTKIATAPDDEPELVAVGGGEDEWDALGF